MKKLYKMPEAKLLALLASDVITASFGMDSPFAEEEEGNDFGRDEVVLK